MAMDIDKDAENNQKVRDRLCVKICKYGSRHPSICRSVFDLFALQSLTPRICHEVIELCLSSFLLMYFKVLAFEGQSLKYSVNMFQRKADN